MRVHIGTSGYSYKEWKGTFYPADLKPDAMLAHYAQKLATVEINNTFYRMPSPAVLGQWAATVPDGFRFVLKAPQRITHQKKLKDATDTTLAFCAIAGALGPKLAALLFQLPPYARKDVATLDAFLAQIAALPSPPRVAFEFRHASWMDDEVHAVLRARGAALCLAESDDAAASEDLGALLVATADWGYLRLRRTDYDDAELAAWATRLRAQPWSDAFVFLKHEDEGKGPAFAMKLRAMFDAAPPAVAPPARASATERPPLRPLASAPVPRAPEQRGRPASRSGGGRSAR